MVLGRNAGTLSGFFSSSCRLRQGDRLSPLLYVIVMGALSNMLTAIVDRGFLSSLAPVVCG
jgi:hypothetical protein